MGTREGLDVAPFSVRDSPSGIPHTAPAKSWNGAEGRKMIGAARLSSMKRGTVRPGWFLAPSRKDWMSAVRDGRRGERGSALPHSLPRPHCTAAPDRLHGNSPR